MSSFFGGPEVGSVYVRVRPAASASAFEAEASPAVRTAGTALGKVFVAAFATVGLADVVKHTVQAAAQQQATFATLNRTVANAGAANDVHGATVDNLIRQQAALKGFSVADLAGAFRQLVSVTKDSGEAFTLLSHAEDLSRGTGRSLAASALATEKAYEGVGTALQRYGIIVPKITSQVDDLRAKHAAEVLAGGQFNASQQAQYAIQLRLATAQDKVLTGQAAIAAIQARFGGVSATFARTAAGEYERLKVGVDQLAVAIGGALLPSLTTGVTDLNRWVDALTKSRALQHDAAVAGHDLGVAFHYIEDAVKTVGPPLLEVAKFAIQVGQAIGAPALLAAAGTFEGIKVATALARDAQGAYNAALIAGGATRAVQVTETQALTTALAENTAALRGQAVAAGEAQLAIDGLGASEATVAAETAGLTGGSFARGLGALATGPAALALGVTALAGGIVYLIGREQTWNGVNGQVTSSVQDLTTALGQQTNAVGALAKEAAANDLAAATAKLVSGLTSAAGLEKQAEALGLTAAHAQQVWNTEIGNQIIALGKTDPVLTRNLTLLAQLTASLGGIANLPPIDIQLLINNQDPNATIQQILTGLTGLDTTHLYDVLRPPPITGATLTRAQTDVAGGFESAAAFALQSAQTGPVKATYTAAGKAAILALEQGLTLDASQQALLNQQMSDAIQQGAISVANAVQQAKDNFSTIANDIATSIGTFIDTPLTLASNSLQLQSDQLAAQYNVLTNQLTLSSAGISAQQAQISLHQQAVNAQFAGQTAVLDRESAQIQQRANQIAFTRIRESLALPGGGNLSANYQTALGQLDALLAKTPARDRVSLQEFIDQFVAAHIAVEKGKIAIREAVPPATAQRSADLGVAAARNALRSSELTLAHDRASFALTERQDRIRVRQDIANIDKLAATKELADLAALYRDKKITLATLDAGLVAQLKKDGVNFSEAGRVDGVAFVDRFLGQITGLRVQAGAIAAGPQQGGGGFLPTIVHPLTTLEQSQKTIGSLALQQSKLNLSELQKHTRILADINKAQIGAGLPKVSSLPRNPGDFSKRVAALTGVSG